MNKDFNKHREIIHDLRGVVGTANFDAKYAAATKHLPKSEKFLLKMELNRLAAPCTRIIDLRGLVDGECRLFDYQGRQHFLDDVAVTTFQEYVDSYDGYKVGVYERVKNADNSFRNIYNKEKGGNNEKPLDQASNKKPTSIKSQYPSKLYQIDTYPNRSEERMNFAIALTIDIENIENIKSSTVDISVNGLKFKLSNEQRIVKGEELKVHFSGLEQEFQFNKDDIYHYQVRNVSYDGNTQILGCHRINVPKQDAFSRFLHGYIQGNKRRYKINLENTLSALQTRSFEQFALIKLNELVIFMRQPKATPDLVTPRYVLTCKNSHPINNYWQDEKKQTTLHFLLNKDRFDRVNKLREQGQKLLVFSFIHLHKGHKYFYSIDEQQIKNDDKFYLQFLAFAASKSSFAITEISCQKISSEQAYAPFTLSRPLSKSHSYLNSPLSQEVIETLAELPYVVTASDITCASDVKDYQALGYEGIDLERLKNYGHKQPSKPVALDEIPMSYGHQRQEMRFKYKTPAVIGCEGVEWEGQSADFSVSGLKIELKNPAMLSKDDVVYLSFPSLQKITSAFDLSHLPYKIIRINKDKTVVNLRVSVKEHQHIGRSFFKLLIDKNKGKLTPDEYAMLMPGLSSALRTIYAVNMSIPSVMVQSSGSRYKCDALVTGKYSYQDQQSLLAIMMKLSDRKGYYNLAPMLASLEVSHLIDVHMKKLVADDPASNELLYIAVKSNGGSQPNSVQVKLATELASKEVKALFIKKSLKQGLFYCVQMRLSRSEEPNMDFLNPELSYISAYAIHRSKQLEQEVFSVAGLIQLVDVTQETLLRYSLPQ